MTGPRWWFHRSLVTPHHVPFPAGEFFCEVSLNLSPMVSGPMLRFAMDPTRGEFFFFGSLLRILEVSLNPNPDRPHLP